MFYALYQHTWHSDLDYDAQELDVVVKQPIWGQFDAAVKLGVGYRDGKSGRENEMFSDMRLLMTYCF